MLSAPFYFAANRSQTRIECLASTLYYERKGFVLFYMAAPVRRSLRGENSLRALLGVKLLRVKLLSVKLLSVKLLRKAPEVELEQL